MSRLEQAEKLMKHVAEMAGMYWLEGQLLLAAFLNPDLARELEKAEVARIIGEPVESPASPTPYVDYNHIARKIVGDYVITICGRPSIDGYDRMKGDDLAVTIEAALRSVAERSVPASPTPPEMQDLRSAAEALLKHCTAEPAGSLSGMADREKRMKWYAALPPLRDKLRAALNGSSSPTGQSSPVAPGGLTVDRLNQLREVSHDGTFYTWSNYDMRQVVDALDAAQKMIGELNIKASSPVGASPVEAIAKAKHDALIYAAEMFEVARGIAIQYGDNSSIVSNQMSADCCRKWAKEFLGASPEEGETIAAPVIHGTSPGKPFHAVCGSDEPNQQTTEVLKNVTCPKCEAAWELARAEHESGGGGTCSAPLRCTHRNGQRPGIADDNDGVAVETDPAPAVTDTSGWKVWMGRYGTVSIELPKECWTLYAEHLAWRRDYKTSDDLYAEHCWTDITSTPKGQEAIASLDKQLKGGGK